MTIDLQTDSDAAQDEEVLVRDAFEAGKVRWI
jgi:hypothetical protein